MLGKLYILTNTLIFWDLVAEPIKLAASISTKTVPTLFMMTGTYSCLWEPAITGQLICNIKNIYYTFYRGRDLCYKLVAKKSVPFTFMLRWSAQ